MSIKIHFVFSLFIHSLILTYFLSFPVFKSSIDKLSFKELFVYLYSEERQGSEKPSVTGKKSAVQKQGNGNKDGEIILPVQKVDNEETAKEVFFPQEQVVEIMRSGVIEQKVFKEGDTSLEVKRTAEHPGDEQKGTDVSDKASLYAQKAPEDTGESSREDVIVYEGTVLKTMPGLTVIPYEDASKIVVLPTPMRQKAAETKEKVEVKVEVEEQQQIQEEVKVEVEVEEHIETKEQVKVAAKAEVRQQIQEEVEVKVEVEEQIETEKHIRDAVETDVPKVVKLHEETETEKAVPAEVDAGLPLETMPGTMTMPLDDESPEDEVQEEAEEHIETKEEVKVEVKVEVEEQQQIQEEVEVEVEAEEWQQIQEEVEVKVEEEQQIKEEVEVKVDVEEQIETAKYIDEQGPETYEGESEPVEPFEFEEAFDRSRVEEKLRYLESFLKEKNKMTKGEVLPEEPVRETLTGKISVPGEKQGGPEKPVTEIAMSSPELAYPENGHGKKDKDTSLKKQDADTQLAGGESLKEIFSLGISEIKTGLLLTSVPGETTVPFKIERALPAERTGEGKELSKKTSEGKETGPLIEQAIEMPIAAGTGRSDESSLEYAQKELAGIEDRERIVAEAVNPESSTGFSHEGDAVIQGLEDRQAQTEPGSGLIEKNGVAEKKPFPAISIPDAFFRKDIRIEIIMNDTDSVSFRLIKKRHPLDEKRDPVGRKEIELVEDTGIDYTEKYKKVFSVAKAEKGIYIFSIENSGAKVHEADILFNILEGKSGARIKEYKTVGLPPRTILKYMFVIPETVFWDDEDYFTGTIESSNTLTKFNEKTGLVWKEDKDR